MKKSSIVSFFLTLTLSAVAEGERNDSHEAYGPL